MICFRDMTFCSSDCVNTDCHRHFGPKVKKEADEWWKGLSGAAPVAFSDFSGDCPAYMPPATVGGDDA